MTDTPGTAPAPGPDPSTRPVPGPVTVCPWEGMTGALEARLTAAATVAAAADEDPDARPARRVVLVGPMGAGKTTVGRALAALTGLPFVDSDELFAQVHGPIPEFFAEHGEAAFRAEEARVIRHVLGRPAPCVLSCGGGAVLHPGTRRALAGPDSDVVYLAVGEAEALRRVGGGAGRVQAGEARRGDVAGTGQVRGVRGEDVADDQVAAGRVGRGQDLGGVCHADAQGRGAGQAEALAGEGGQAGVDLHRGLVGARVRVVHPAGERAARPTQVQGPQRRGLRPVRPDGCGGPAHVLEGHALGALGVQRRGLDAVDVEDERARLEGVLADLGGAVGDRVDARLDPGGAGGSARGPAPARRRPAAHAAPPSCGRRRTISCSCRPAHGPVIGSGAPTAANPCLA